MECRQLRQGAGGDHEGTYDADVGAGVVIGRSGPASGEGYEGMEIADLGAGVAIGRSGPIQGGWLPIVEKKEPFGG